MGMTQPSDVELLARLRSGDGAAFALLRERCAAPEAGRPAHGSNLDDSRRPDPVPAGSRHEPADETDSAARAIVLAIILTHLIDNSATAIILAPLAYQIARELHVNPKPFLVALAICISASFSTPIAHESTILVMGPGRYQFKHYLKIGGVMALITWLAAMWLTPLVWPFR